MGRLRNAHPIDLTEFFLVRAADSRDMIVSFIWTSSSAFLLILLLVILFIFSVCINSCDYTVDACSLQPRS